MITKYFVRPLSALLLAALTLIPCISKAQVPIALPSTMTTLAGGLVPTSYTAGTTLCPGSTTVKAVTASGDNCPAIAATLGAAGRGGVAVDQYGNVFVADDVTKAVHMIDQTTGTMTVVAGLGTVCGSSSGKLSSAGDGCLAATQTVLGGPRGIGLDAYGNVLIPEYSQNVIHIVCRNASPLCAAGTPAPTAANPIQVQIGYMGIVGGCLAGSGSTGTAPTSGSSASGVTEGLDGTPGFSTYNSTLTNTASYPATLSGTASAFKVAGSCTTSNGEVGAPRAAWGDIYGNVYYADTNTSRTRVILGPYQSSYFSGVNPLYAALAINTNWTWTGTISSSTLKPGYVYTVANVSGYYSSTYNSTAAVIVGSSCLKTITGDSVTFANSTITSKALDTHADGCPFFDTAITPSSGYTDTAVTDAAGNLIFTDPGAAGLLRIFYVQGWASSGAAASAGSTGSVASAGVAMYNAIVKNNPGVTPTPGYVYALAGGAGLGQTGFTAATLAATPTLGNATTIASTTINKVAISPQGNIYIGNGTQVLFYDMATGSIRILLKAGASPATAGAYCTGSSGAVSKSIYGDGCPVTGTTSYANFGNTNALSVAVDGQGNLYLYDSASYGSGMLVRKVLAQGIGSDSSTSLAARSKVANAFPLQALGTPQAQTFMVHFPNATAASASITESANPNFTHGSMTCNWYSSVDNSMDCQVPTAYTPTAAGPQSASMTITASGGEVATLNMGGTVAGSVLAIDGANSGGSNLLTTASLFSGSTPYSVAVDGAGNVYASISTSGTFSIVESLAGSPSSMVPLASGLTAMPSSLAVDRTGNIYYLNGSSSIQELAVSASGSTNTYTPTTLSYVPMTPWTANPVALAVDSAGNLFVADNQSGTDYFYRISTAAFNTYGSAVCNAPATAATPTLCQSVAYGNNNGTYGPMTAGVVNALAVDPSGNIYVSDAANAKIYELTPGIDTTFHLWDYNGSTPLTSTSTTGLATDAAGNLYVQNSSGVTMYPQSGPTPPE